MQNIVIDKPYKFVAPHRSTFWPRALQALLPIYLRKWHGIEAVEFRGLRYLESSISRDNPIALTPNHCRPCDPMVMGLLSKEIGRPFHFMTSWHVFMQGRLQAWLVNRLGAFSVYREGVDRQAIRAATEILVEGKRPMVLFPEGLVTRTNDVLRPFMDGISVIAGAATKQRRARSLPPAVAIHPVAIKYRLVTDVEASLHKTLDAIEARFCWRRRRLPLVERIVRVGEALLALKELEYLGQARSGAIAERLDDLIEHILGRLESRWIQGRIQPSFIGRVKALRAVILKDMLTCELSNEERKARWCDLADIDLAVQLSSYPPHYVRSHPTAERLTETVERLEEDLTDKTRLHGRWRAILQVGEPVVVDASRQTHAACLSQKLEQAVQRMLHGAASSPEVGA